MLGELMGIMRKRKTERSAMTKTVFYLNDNADDLNHRYFAITVNVSECGACIYTDRPISKGDVFLLESRLWPETREARAVWSKQLGDSLFEAGISLC